MEGGLTMRTLWKQFIEEEEAMGVIEVILIIVVLVGLALIFRTQITSIANSLFSKIRNQVSSF